MKNGWKEHKEVYSYGTKLRKEQMSGMRFRKPDFQEGCLLCTNCGSSKCG
jgi:hypothetical protein